MIHHLPDKSGFVAHRAMLGAADGDTSAAVVFISSGTVIDNRIELAGRLGLDDSVGNEPLLLTAWHRWREGMADHLRGAFAFAIYDAVSGSLFMARDIFGRAPVFFYVDADHVVAGATSRIARAIAPVTMPLDRRMCADFIHGIFVERTNSFFLGLERLPPAHWMKIDRDQVQTVRYWSPDAIAPRQALADAPEQFREIFDRAVDRACGGHNPALMLSGGLDSSAILGSIMARDVLAKAPDCLSKTYRKSGNWVDAPFIEVLQRQFDLSVTEIPCDDHDPLADMEFWLDVLDGPYVSYGHSVASQLLPIARDMGHDCVLSGHGGDEIVSYGMGRINELAVHRRWLRLWIETKGMTGLSGQSRVRVLRKYLTHYPRYRAVERRIQRRFPDRAIVEDPALPDPLIETLDPARYTIGSVMDRIDHDEHMIHVESLENPVQPLALETIGQCSRAVGLETAMPFYDRELVELTLSLPSEWKLRNGFSRYVLRRAMAERLPDRVVRRRDKFDFTNAFVAGLVKHREKVLALTADANGILSEYVNLSRLSSVRDRLSSPDPSMPPADARFIWRCAVFAMWLGQLSMRPAPLAMMPLARKSPT